MPAENCAVPGVKGVRRRGVRAERRDIFKNFTTEPFRKLWFKFKGGFSSGMVKLILQTKYQEARDHVLLLR